MAPTIIVRKAKPTPSDAHVSAPLTNVSVGYVQEGNWGAERIFPYLPVAKQSDLYYIFNREDFLRDEAQVRAPGRPSAGGNFSLSTAGYACVVEAYHKDIDDQLRANADSVLALDSSTTKFVTQKLMIRRERRFMSSFFTTGVWGTDITPSTLWDVVVSGVSTSDPQADVDAGILAIQEKTGMKPNKLSIGARVFRALRRHTKVRDQFKYTSPDSIDEAMLANFFGVDEVVVFDKIYSSAIHGQTGVSPSFIAGKHALLTFTTDSPALMTPTAGYIMAWSGFTGSVNGMRTKKFRMEENASDRIEGESAYAMKVVAPECGYFFNSVIS